MVGGIENGGYSMPRTRKSHPPSLKAKVAIEAIKAHKTTTQIAQIYGVPVFRQSSDGGYARGEPQAHPAADADIGNRGALSETELEPAGAWTRGLPPPAAERIDRPAQPSLEYRYY